MFRMFLKIDDVYKFFGGLAAVNGVSLELEEGVIAGLIGPNGSGKTTLFNLITGVLRPDKGAIYFRGVRIDGLKPHEIYRHGIVRSFQIPRVFNKVTVSENFMLPPKNQRGENPFIAPFHRLWRKQEESLAEKAADLIEKLNLTQVYKTWSTNISGGQMKLTEIGRALMEKVYLVLLDEPTAGVAPNLAHEIFRFIREIRDMYGITFFIIEHRLDVLFKYVEKVFVMHQGKIIAEGSPEEIGKNPLVIEAYLGESL
jgi:branched-chain amino acid transport system ATP-binding protein